MKLLLNFVFIIFLSIPTSHALAGPVQISLGKVDRTGEHTLEIASDASFSSKIVSQIVRGTSFTWDAPEGTYYWRLLGLNGTKVDSGMFIVLGARTPSDKLAKISWKPSGAKEYRVHITEKNGKTRVLSTSSPYIYIPRQTTYQSVAVSPLGKSASVANFFLQNGLTIGATNGTPADAEKPILEEHHDLPVPDTASKPILEEKPGTPLVQTQEPDTTDGEIVEMIPGGHSTEHGIPPNQQLQQESENKPQQEPTKPQTEEPPPPPPPAIKDDEKESKEPTPVTKPILEEKEPKMDFERRVHFVQGFLTYKREKIRSQKLEIDLISPEQLAGAGLYTWTNPWSGLVIDAWWDYHEHSAKMRQSEVFGDKDITFHKSRYTLDGGIGWDILSPLDLNKHLLAIKFRVANIQLPSLPTRFNVIPGESAKPGFSNETLTLMGIGAEYILFGSRLWTFVLQLGYLASDKNNGLLIYHRLWAEYYVKPTLALTLGALSRNTSMKVCDGNSGVCLQEGKVHTTVSELGGFLGVGYRIGP